MARMKKNKKGYFVKTFMYDNKRQYVYAKTQEELAQKVVDRKTELETGARQRQNPRLKEYYRHFVAMRKDEIRESTQRGQTYQFNNIASVELSKGVAFGDLRLKDITRKDIETVRQTLVNNGFTPEYLNICFAHLNHVFVKAVIDETIEKNPCKSLKPLRRSTAPISENKHRALSETETIEFFKVATQRNSYYINILRFMLLTGLRIGEVGALHLTDIDYKKGFVYVRRSITRDETGAYIVGDDTKTYSGKRDIPLTPELIRVINTQKELNNMIFGLGWSGTLFKSIDNHLLREYTVNREIARICKQAEIEKFTCHALRVTFATRFIEQRPQDYKILSEILGHKDISITLNLYTRVMTENKIAAMQDLKIKTS